MIDFCVNMHPEQAAATIERYVQASGFSAEIVDRYSNHAGAAGVIVLVFEKYYMRNDSRASLTVTIENLSGTTKIHAAGSGGGQGAIFGFDWGAADSFEDLVQKAFR